MKLPHLRFIPKVGERVLKEMLHDQAGDLRYIADVLDYIADKSPHPAKDAKRIWEILNLPGVAEQASKIEHLSTDIQEINFRLIEMPENPEIWPKITKK